MRTVTLVVVLGSLLTASIWFAVYLWRELGAAQMSWHGYMALGLGAGLTVILGVGLMALAFYSSRHGHDELAYGASDDQRSASSLQADP